MPYKLAAGISLGVLVTIVLVLLVVLEVDQPLERTPERAEGEILDDVLPSFSDYPEAFPRRFPMNLRRGLFDNIPHDRLMKAVRHHTDCKWVVLYIECWLKSPMQMDDGELRPRDRGTPHSWRTSSFTMRLTGGWRLIFLSFHFADTPMTGLVHCRTLKQALYLRHRLEDPGGLLQGYSSTEKDYEHIQFDFLGYTFRPRKSIGKGRATSQ